MSRISFAVLWPWLDWHFKQSNQIVDGWYWFSSTMVVIGTEMDESARKNGQALESTEKRHKIIVFLS